MLEYLKVEYAKTLFPFFSVRKLKRLGVFDKDEANKLANEGKVRKRDGMHGVLIELIIDKDEN